jgi:PAS domain S-box-containing protein
LQLDGAIEQCNAAFGRLFDAIPTHFLGIQLSSLVDPEHTAVIQTAIATVQATLQNQQVLVRVLRDGSSELNALELEIGFSPVAYGTERVSNIVGIVRNVTERARSQQIIAEERNLLRTLIDAVPDYIYVKDRQHRVLLSNAAQIRLWGGPPDSPNWALGKTDADIFSQELATKYRTDEANLISSGKPLINIEERSRNEHGQEIWVLTTKVPLRNLHGEIIGLVGITRDISEAKASAEALQLSEQQLRDSQQRLTFVLDTIPVRVFWKDRNSVYLGCNRAYAEDAGLESVDAIVGKRDVDLPRTATESANFVNVDRVIIETGYPLLRYEQSLTLSNGDRRTIVTSKFPLQDAQGTIIGVLGMYEDITFLKQNQLEAQRYQADLKSVIESTSTAFILLNRDGVIRLMNRNAENIFRRAYGDNIAVGHRIYDYLPPEQRAIYDGGLERVLAGETVKIEGQSEAVVPPNYFEVTNYPVRAENGEVIGINLAYEDVTARKETERQLRFSANLQESMHEAVIGTDIEFRVRSWNKAAERIYGWTAEEMFGRDTIDVLHTVMSDNMTAAEGRHKLLEVGYWHGELLHHHRDGTPLIVLASISLIRDENGQAIGVVAVNQDITERKRTEAQLQASREEEAQFQLQLKTLHEISIALTRLNTLDEFYRQVIELGRARLGFERLGLFLYDAEHDRALGTYGTTASGELHDERDLVFKPSDFTGLFQRVLERNERVALERSIQLYVAGQPAGNGWNAVVGLWQGQNLLGWLAASGADPGNGSDVATVVVETLLLYGLTVSALLANKRTEEHLYQITQRLEIATASGGIGTWDWDVATSQVTWDDRMYALHGLQRQGEFLDREAYRAVVHPDDIDRLDREVAEIFTQLTPQDSEVRIIRPDGEMRYLRASGVPLLDNTGRVYRVVGVNWDVTSWRRGEVALMEALEKEKEVSELKSRFISIASHEFRTPLATIRATTDVLLSYRDRLTADKIDSRLRKIAQQVDHMKGLLEDVLYLARVQAGRIEFRPALGDIESLTRDIIEEFESQPEHRDRIRFESPQQAIIISMDIRLMRQLIGNLISNALKYSAVTKPVYVTLAQNTNWIVITVKDEGIGIPTEDLKHLFEPFHRAVNVGTISGTGLGLSIMKQAVELHQGSVVVDSILDQGSTFSITLPIGEIGILA